MNTQLLKTLAVFSILYCTIVINANAQVQVRTPVKHLQTIPTPVKEQTKDNGVEVFGSWTLGASGAPAYSVKYFDAPWSLELQDILSFHNGGFMCDGKGIARVRIQNGKKGQKFTIQITATAPNSCTLSLSNNQSEQLGTVKLSSNNQISIVSFVYESNGTNGNFLSIKSDNNYWNLEKITITSIK